MKNNIENNIKNNRFNQCDDINGILKIKSKRIPIKIGIITGTINPAQVPIHFAKIYFTFGIEFENIIFNVPFSLSPLMAS